MHFHFLLLGFANIAIAGHPASKRAASKYWWQLIKHNGIGSSKTYIIHRNVNIYGAKGDGTTDDSAAIQKVINAVDGAGNAVINHGPWTDYLLSSLPDLSLCVLLMWICDGLDPGLRHTRPLPGHVTKRFVRLYNFSPPVGTLTITDWGRFSTDSRNMVFTLPLFLSSPFLFLKS
jgi:hypothetical protein